MQSFNNNHGLTWTVNWTKFLYDLAIKCCSKVPNFWTVLKFSWYKLEITSYSEYQNFLISELHGSKGMNWKYQETKSTRHSTNNQAKMKPVYPDYILLFRQFLLFLSSRSACVRPCYFFRGAKISWEVARVLIFRIVANQLSILATSERPLENLNGLMLGDLILWL